MSRQPPPTGTPPKQYSPDGRWYWDGTRWLPVPPLASPGRLDGMGTRSWAPPPAAMAEVAPPLQVEAPPAPHRPRRRSSLVGVAIAAVALIVLGSVGSVAVIAIRGRLPTVPGSAPSAQAIFEMPYTDGVRSARFRVSGHAAGSTWTGSGVIEFAPEHAFSQTLRDPATGTVFEQDVETGGVAYSAQAGSRYRATDYEVNDFGFIGWDGRPAPRQLEVTGQTRLEGQQAWVLKEAGTSDKWVVAEHTGDPLEAVVSGYDTYTFSDWNRAPAIRAPAASEISSGLYSGSGSAPAVAPAATVRVLKARVDSNGGGDPTGFRTVALDISYKNTASSASNFDNDPSLVSSDGVFGDTTSTALSPPLQAARVARGQTVTGWDAFVVPRQATRFHFLFGEQLDQEADLDYLISIAVEVPG
ncbi:MAG: hypothetical protein J2P44_06365 [Candidatus Dormibacteraeota bacterium]|nr:hypothetical protein [Candidatus Dormibacteraeota bacterium]